MGVRVGVDVGGTFTKAVAFDTAEGAVVARAVVPTTHSHADGVAAGVVEVVAEIAQVVGGANIDLVTHSTTQAVNALLEGDVAKIGMIGMGRGPDVRKARKRTTGARVELADRRVLQTVEAFLDVTDGLTADAAAAAVQQVKAGGAEAIAVAEAFAPDDLTNETIVRDAAEAAGLPVTTSAELSGLYGLELRSVTAALNACIVPIALRTADVVERGVGEAGIASPVMVLRGDGGATDLVGFRQAPARTLYSGPAASVAGALRSGRLGDAVIVEVGGTSTNVAAIRRGRPALSYVRVASHVTAIRALDVRVIGVAGGSMLRVRRNRVYGVGPRSAHIAGLPYACFLTADAFDGARVELIAPRPGDPAEHLILRLTDGTAAALTNTCAANAAGLVAEGDYAYGDPAAALAAFDVAGRTLRLPGMEVAKRMLQASTQAVGDLVASVIADHHLEGATIVAVGGGAGAIGRAVATGMGLDIVVPPDAEVISAVGDALSLIRVEREQTIADPTSSDSQHLIAEVEAEALRAGAAEAGLDVRIEHIPDRSALRVTATGAVALSSGAIPGRHAADENEAVAAAASRGYGEPARLGSHWLASKSGRDPRVALFDRYADLIIDIRGEATTNSEPAHLDGLLRKHTRRVGPMQFAPDAWVVAGSRFLQVPDATPSALAEAARALSTDSGSTPGTPPTILIGRE